MQARLAAIGRRLAALPPRAILAIGWTVVIVYGFPGMMTMDSIQQLQEARASFYTDYHPAVMAHLWHYLDAIVPGPFLMFVLQVTLFFLGLYLVLRRALSPRCAAVATCLVALFPPVLAPMGVIWKDCLMAGGLLLGLAGLLSERRAHRVWALVACAFASSVRYNAPAATLPLIVLLFEWLPRGPAWQLRIRRYAIATGAWLAVTIVAIGADMLLTDREMHPWQSTLALFDTVGTLANVDEDIPDDQLRELTAGTGLLVDHDIHAAIRAKYSTTDFEPLIHGDGHLWDVVIAGTDPLPDDKNAAISKMFWTTVTAHPGAWLRHRFATMRPIIALGGPVYSPVMIHRVQYKDILERELDLTSHTSPVQNFMEHRVMWVARHTPLFRPWIYLALALILLAFTRAHRDIAALLLSGIGLEASLWLLAPTPDYRYSHWLVISICLAVIMLVARRARDTVQLSSAAAGQGSTRSARAAERA